MRPAGERINLSLLNAARELVTDEQAPTLMELALHAQVSFQSARDNVPKMKRHGMLRIVRTRRVAYRNRPVAEYAPCQPATPATENAGADLGAVLRAWA